MVLGNIRCLPCAGICGGHIDSESRLLRGNTEMALQRYHLLKKNDEWRLRKAGTNRRAVVKADTKEIAILEMRGYMNTHAGVVRIHKANGRIQEERTYPRREG